jgi:hypothetical protein
MSKVVKPSSSAVAERAAARAGAAAAPAASAGPAVPAAIGWRVHSGWASQIALAGPLRAPAVLERRRVELVDPAGPGAAQPYHAARLLPLDEAERWISRCRESTLRLARQALQATGHDLRRQGYRAVACGLLDSSARPLPAFAAVLASHALVHTAEGELFRDALAAAARADGLPVARLRERDLAGRCAAMPGITPEHIRRHLAELGTILGPPWRQDEKLATLAAWLALASTPAAGV